MSGCFFAARAGETGPMTGRAFGTFSLHQSPRPGPREPSKQGLNRQSELPDGASAQRTRRRRPFPQPKPGRKQYVDTIKLIDCRAGTAVVSVAWENCITAMGPAPH